MKKCFAMLARRQALAALLALVLCSFSCTNDSGSRRALESEGFTEIQLTGYSWLSCGKDDTFATGFTAKNAKGNPVSGTVCCGLVKGCTIRF